MAAPPSLASLTVRYSCFQGEKSNLTYFFHVQWGHQVPANTLQIPASQPQERERLRAVTTNLFAIFSELFNIFSWNRLFIFPFSIPTHQPQVGKMNYHVKYFKVKIVEPAWLWEFPEVRNRKGAESGLIIDHKCTSWKRAKVFPYVRSHLLHTCSTRAPHNLNWIVWVMGV